MALNANDIGGLLTTMFNHANTSLGVMANVLLTDGQDLAGMLLFISTGITVLFWLISGDGSQALVQWFSTVLRFAVVMVLLGGGWSGWISGGLEAGANEVATKLNAAGGGSTSASSAGVLADAATTIMVTAGRLLTSERETADVQCAVTGGLGCGKSAVVKAMDMADLLFSPGSAVQVLFTWLLRLLAVLFLGVMLAVLTATLFLAQVMFGISLIVGPILVPWLIWQRTEFLFDGWLKFTIAAMLTKIVAVVMTVIIFALIFKIKALGDNVINVSSVDLVTIDEMAALLICVIAAMGAFLMWQVPSLAQSLISGGTGSIAGFGRGLTGTVRDRARATSRNDSKPDSGSKK